MQGVAYAVTASMSAPTSLALDTVTHMESTDQPHLCKACTKALLSARGESWRNFYDIVESTWLRRLAIKVLRPPWEWKTEYACRPLLDEGCFLCWRVAQSYREPRGLDFQTIVSVCIDWIHPRDDDTGKLFVDIGDHRETLWWGRDQGKVLFQLHSGTERHD